MHYQKPMAAYASFLSVLFVTEEQSVINCGYPTMNYYRSPHILIIPLSNSVTKVLFITHDPS